MPPNPIYAISAERSVTNPLITFASCTTLDGNINGPSVIKVPSWIKNPKGKYYMYFAHHEGNYIRLAYSDALIGPWQIHPPGTLRLDQAKGFHGHIASPDVHVDDEKQEIRMYFHGRLENLRSKQKSGVAISKDGLAFTQVPGILGPPYFRVFRWKTHDYAIDGSGRFSRSKDGLTRFRSRGWVIPALRHAAVLIQGDMLLCFYSRIGDAPEGIMVSTLQLNGNWKSWTATAPLDVLKPEKDYEGTQFPIKASKSGIGTKVQELRDPCIYQEDGRVYLFYSYAGEMGIAMAELDIKIAPIHPPVVPPQAI